MEKKKNEFPLWALWLGAFGILSIICFLLLFFSEVKKPTEFISNGLVAFISALIGVVLTVLVTQILLQRQTKAQAELQKEQTEAQAKLQKEQLETQAKLQMEQEELRQKLQTEQFVAQQDFQRQLLERQSEKETETDKDIRVFQKKIKVYSMFIGEMWAMLSNEKQNEENVPNNDENLNGLTNQPKSIISYDMLEKLRTLCFKELVFYLNATQVKDIADKMQIITPDQESDQAIHDAMNDVTAILQKSVYSSEEKKEEIKGSNLKTLFASFKTEKPKEEKQEEEKQENKETSSDTVSNITPYNRPVLENSQQQNITFWHFIMLNNKQLEVFNKKDNWFLSLIEYGDNSKTQNLKRLQPNDVVFLFQTGGYGYIGAFKVTGYMIINAKEKKVEWKRIENGETKESTENYNEDNVKKYQEYDIYDAIDDGADYVSNILVEPLAYNYKGVGCYTVRRQTIQKFVYDPVSVGYILEGFSGKGRNKDGFDKFSMDKNIIIDPENKNFLNNLWGKVDYLSKQRKVLELRDDINKATGGIEFVEIHQFRLRYYNKRNKMDWKEFIFLDTVITDNNQWKIILFHGSNNLEIIEKDFPEIIEKYSMKVGTSDEAPRYETKLYNDKEIADVLMEFWKMVEEKIKGK